MAKILPFPTRKSLPQMCYYVQKDGAVVEVPYETWTDSRCLINHIVKTTWLPQEGPSKVETHFRFILHPEDVGHYKVFIYCADDPEIDGRHMSFSTDKEALAYHRWAVEQALQGVPWWTRLWWKLRHKDY